MEKNITIRTAVQSDLPSIIELCRTTCRYVSLEELSVWMQFDPGCFIVAELAADVYVNDNAKIDGNAGVAPKEIVATCCGMRLGVDLGHVTLFMVHERHRRRGIGKMVFNRAMGRLDGRNVGLKTYASFFTCYVERFGFGHEYKIATCQCFDGSKLLGEVPSVHGLSLATIFEGQFIEIQNVNDEGGRSRPRVSLHLASRGLTSRGLTSSGSVPPLHISHASDADAMTLQKDETVGFFDDLLNRVVDYDRRLHNNGDRSFVVRQTFSWKSCRTIIVVADDNRVVGYGCLRRCISGLCVLSPLYADCQEIAEILLLELIRGFDFSGTPEGILLRFPEENAGWTDFLEKRGFRTAAELCGSGGYTKEFCGLGSDKLYGYHSIDV